MNPPRDILELDPLIDKIWPLLRQLQQDYRDGNGKYRAFLDLSDTYSELPPETFFVHGSVKPYAFQMYCRKTSSTPITIREGYVEKWDYRKPPEDQLVEYRNIDYYDWERMVSVDGKDTGWSYGVFE